MPSPDRGDMDAMPFGVCDPVDRVAYRDKEGLDGVVLYPTIGIVWPSVVEDAELADVYARGTTAGSPTSAATPWAGSSPSRRSA